MSLDNIQLPPIVVADLYRKTLVQLNPHKQTIPQHPQVAMPEAAVAPQQTDSQLPAIKYLGKNLKGIVLLVHDKSALHLAETQMEFLIKVIAACQLTMDDCAVVNLAHQAGDYLALETQLNATSVIMMGVTPQQINLPLAFPQYQVQAYRNTRFVCSQPIAMLMTDVEEKRKFWTTLKSIFNLN
jgi:hypothetical protein